MAIATPSSLDDFVASALKEEIRMDGRRPFDSRRLNIKFSRYSFFFILSILLLLSYYLSLPPT